MGAEVIALISGCVGLVTGAAAGLAVRLSERQEGRAAPPADTGAPASSLPAGAAAVLSVLPSSAVVVDSADRVLRASSAARAFGLVKGDELVVAELLALIRRVRRDGEIRETEIQVRGETFGAELTTFAVRVAPLGAAAGPDGLGPPAGSPGPPGTTGLVLVLAEDQTERRLVEAVRRDFVANVSHELKTPVGALALLAETVEDAADDPDAVRRFAGRMRQEADRLTRLVQDLIMLSRVQGGRLAGDRRPVRIEDVVREAVDGCRLRAAAKDILLAGSGPADLVVDGDEDLLTTAVRNLVDNAIAYSPERTRIAVATRLAGDVAEIAVSDQGIGIPESERDRIFERFYRIDPARSRATGGTGLGLAIVKHVAAGHGGEVTVWSKPGTGSTFTLRLPVAGSRAGQAGPSGSSIREVLR